MELDHLSIRVSWAGLLNGEIVAEDIILENPKVSLSRDGSGNLDLIQALYSPEDTPSKSQKSIGFPSNVIVRRLKVVNAWIEYKTSEQAAGNPKDQVVLRKVNLLITDVNVVQQKGRVACQIAGGDIRSRGAQTTIDRLSFSADIVKNRMDALVLDVSTDGLDVNLAGTVKNLFSDTPVLKIGVKGRVILSQINELVPLLPGASGEIRLNSKLTGPLNNPDVDLTLDYEDGALSGNKVDQIHLNCRLTDRSLNISDLNLYTVAGRFDITGRIDFRKAFYDGWFTADPDLGAVAYTFSILRKTARLDGLALGMAGLKGDVTANMKLQGKGVDPKTLWADTSLDAYVGKFSVGEGNSPIDIRVRSTAGMQRGRIEVYDFNANADGAKVEITGSYDVHSQKVAAHFNLDSPDLNEIMRSAGIKGLSGKFNVKGEISGTAKAPLMDMRMQGKALGYEDVRIGSADATLRFSKGRLFLENGKIANGNSILDISGSARIFAPMDFQVVKPVGFDVALKGDALFLEDFVEGMKGKFVISGRIAGDTMRPKGALDLNGEDIDLNIQKVRGIQLSLKLDEDTIEFAPFSLVIAPGEKIQAHGRLSLDKNYEVRLTSGDISLKNLAQGYLGDVDSGKIAFDLEGKGNLENPQIQGKLVLSDLRFNTQQFKDVGLQIEVKDQVVRIAGDPGFDLNANYHLLTKTFFASAVFDDTSLTPYLNLSGPSDLHGTLTGKIEVTGNTEAPGRIRGSADVSRIEILKNQTELIDARDFKTFLEDGKISIPGVRLNLLGRGVVEISGTGKLNGDINLEAGGTLPMEIVSLLNDTLPNATGEARFALSARGNLSQPYFRGDVQLINAGLTFPVFLQRLHDLNGSVHITPDSIVLENFQGMLDTGNFKLFGTVDFKAYQPAKVDLKINVDELPVVIPDALDARLNAELDIRGTPEKSLTSGYIHLIEGKYFKDIRINLIESLQKKARQETPVPSEVPRPFLKNMALDISIRYGEPFVVDNNLALLFLKPDLHINGTASRPLISGRAEVESGSVYFQKSEFNVKKGVFDFINPYKIEPTVDIESETKIREWTVFLNVSGVPDNLAFNLTSNPPETREDLISLLIVGKTTRELIAREGGSSFSPRQMLADALAGTVQEEIKEATGLDVVALEYNEAKDAEASDSLKVTVGKELSRRVTVKYDVMTKNAKTIQKIITEYKFLEKVLMNTFQDTEGHYGGGLQFRLEFR